MNKMKYIIFTLVFIPFITFGQQTNGIPPGSLSYYLTKYPSVFRGTVKPSGTNKFKIKVTNWVKNENKHGKTIILNTYNQRNDTSMLACMGMEMECEYLFIGGTQRNCFTKTPLRATELRFKIVNDSIFIPTALLDQLPELKLLNINQVNTFKDPKIKFGYKISLNDFIEISRVLNSSFSWVRPKKPKYRVPPYLAKSKELISSDNVLIIALLNELEILWKRQNE